MGGKFKFQVQDSDLEYLFWRFDKRIALSEKKLPYRELQRVSLELSLGQDKFYRGEGNSKRVNSSL